MLRCGTTCLARRSQPAGSQDYRPHIVALACAGLALHPEGAGCCARVGCTRHEDRAGRAADGKRAAAPLWRHRADRLLPHRRAGRAGPRRHAVRERRFHHRGQARALLRAGAAAQPGRARSHPLLHADARQGAPAGAASSTSSTSTSTSSISRSSATSPTARSRRCTAGRICRTCCRSTPAFPRCRWCRSRMRSASRCPTPPIAATIHHGLPRDLLDADAAVRAAAISPSSAASRPRSASTAPSASRARSAFRSRSRPRSIASTWTTSRREIEPMLDAARRRVHRRDRRAPQAELPRRGARAAVSDRLAGAVRPGDDRGHGVRHAGARLPQRLGAGGHRRGRHRLHRRQRGGGRAQARRRCWRSIAGACAGASRSASRPRAWPPTM